MKQFILFVSVCFVVGLITAQACPAGEWQYGQYDNEMGDFGLKMAYVADNDPEYDGVFYVLQRNDVMTLALVVDKRFIDTDELEVQVDGGEVVALPALTYKQMILAPAISQTLLYQLKTGHAVKVRYYTQAASHTIDFPLEGSAKAINQLEGGAK